MRWSAQARAIIVFTTGDVGQLPEATGNPAAAVGTAFSQAYNAQMQAALAADCAVRRARGIGRHLADRKSDQGKSGEATASPMPAHVRLACIGNPALQNQYLFYFDGVHLTSLGFTIVGEYIVNRLEAPLTFGRKATSA